MEKCELTFQKKFQGKVSRSPGVKGSGLNLAHTSPFQLESDGGIHCHGTKLENKKVQSKIVIGDLNVPLAEGDL
jgi:hypothetical protein